MQYPQNIQPQYQQNTHQQNRQKYQFNFTDVEMYHYFHKPSVVYMWLLILGAALCLFGLIFLPLLYYLLLPGIGLLTWGGTSLLAYSQRPKDEEYAAWVFERSQSLYNTALQRLQLDESQCESIIEVQGGISSLLQLTKKFPEEEIRVKRVPYGFRHYSINVSTYIFLTKDSIAIYSGYINALTQQERFEDADHYYYKDVVGVSTSGPIYIFENESSEKEIQMQGFLVRMNNGDVVGTDYATRVILRYVAKGEPVEGVDKVVAALLSLLRDHKVTLIEANKISKDTTI